MIPEESKLKIIKYAARAPSEHNTQPWRFTITGNTITIFPDFSRSLAVADSDNHALYISLGCALENMIIAANEYNYLAKPDTGINENEIKSLMPYIIRGNELQSGNKLFINKLVTWFRFSEKEAMLKGDGVWSASFGLPAMGRFIGPVCMKLPVSSVRESRRLAELILTSSGLVMFLVEKNDPVQWIKLGRYFQRFGLKAAKYHISYAHLDMPLKVSKVRDAIIHDFQLNGLTPLLLIRIGFSDTMPYSFRKNIFDLLIK